MAEDRTQPPPGFEWGPTVDGVRTVVADGAIVDQASHLGPTFIDGPLNKLTVNYAWEWRDRMLALLSGEAG